MSKLKISDDLYLPLDAVTQKFAFLGRTGSGKTYAAKKLAELMLFAGAQVVVLDPVGVWFGLRIGPGAFGVPVLGGLHGDIPLEPTAGAVVADLVFDRSISVVLDVSQMTDADATRFATGFAARFFQRQKAAARAVHVFIEECQHFVPQEPQRNETQMLHEFQKLSKLGRNFGIGVSLISQRPQEVNKKALNQTECLFAFQMTGPQERKAMEAWVSDKGIDADIKAILPKLAVGEPHVWSPQWLKFSKVVQILPIRSRDTSSTPQVGPRQRVAEKLATIDLKKLQESMAATIEKAKADDPRELKRRIAELEKQLKAKRAAEPERVEVPVFDERRAAQLHADLFGLVDSAVTSLNRLKSEAGALLNGYREEQAAIARRSIFPQTSPAVVHRHTKPEKSSDGHRANFSQSTPGPGPGEPMPSAERKVLTALAQSGGRATKRKVALLAGYAVGGGGFNNALSRLRTKGWVLGSGELEAKSAGLAALGKYDALPTGTDLVDYWVRELGRAEGAIVLRLFEAGGELAKAELAERAGYEPSGGGFNNALSRLRTLELVSGSGTLKLSEELFG